MSRFQRLTLIVLIAFVALSTPVALLACPNCKFSPNHWGFCRYYFQAGGTSCEEYVVDEFSGRTGCYVWGECRWYSDGSPGGPLEGPFYPDADDYGSLTKSPGTALASARPACSSWTDTPSESLLVF